MRDDYGIRGDLPAGGPPYPKTVTAAGVIWIVIGCVFLLHAVVNLVLTIAGFGATRGFSTAQGMSVSAVGALFAAACLYVGVKSVRGTARDLLGNAVGSIIFALLGGGSGIAGVRDGLEGEGPAAIIEVSAGAIVLLVGLALLVAGVLALVGSKGCKAWRRAQRQRMASEGEGP
jgi:hypothetical protein